MQASKHRMHHPDIEYPFDVHNMLTLDRDLILCNLLL